MQQQVQQHALRQQQQEAVFCQIAKDDVDLRQEGQKVVFTFISDEHQADWERMVDPHT
jgi:hypothetical protein